MDSNTLGYTFLPNTRKRITDTANGAGANPLQQALRTLSLRLPSVLGGSPFTPETNLKPQIGGGATDPSAVVQSLLQAPSTGGASPDGAAAAAGGGSGEMRALLAALAGANGSPSAVTFHPINPGDSRPPSGASLTPEAPMRSVDVSQIGQGSSGGSYQDQLPGTAPGTSDPGANIFRRTNFDPSSIQSLLSTIFGNGAA